MDIMDSVSDHSSEAEKSEVDHRKEIIDDANDFSDDGAESYVEDGSDETKESEESAKLDDIKAEIARLEAELKQEGATEKMIAEMQTSTSTNSQLELKPIELTEEFGYGICLKEDWVL